jgi:hypothetical protein
MSVLDLHFADRLAEIEARLAAGAGPQAFAGVDDDLFTLLSSRDYPGHEAIRNTLPEYPPERYAADCTGNLTMYEAVKEAALFWRLAKEVYREHSATGRPLDQATVADYGAGWGRITRLCPKDAAKVYAIEPNLEFQKIYQDTRVPGELVASDYLSSKRLPVTDVDLLFCFSIYTHASAKLAKNIRDRWVEMVRPGGVVLFTIRPATYMDEAGGGEISRLNAKERAALKAAYAKGQLGYWPYPGLNDWGITVAPMAYLEKLFSKHFEIIGPRYFLQNFTQLPIVMVRRGGEARSAAAPARPRSGLFGG